MLPPRAGIIATLARGHSFNKIMQLKIVKHQILYKDNRFHAAFPSIIKLDNGELLLAFRRARDCNWLLKGDGEFDPLASMDHLDSRSHICLINFNENLEEIGGPRIYPIDPEVADQDPSLLNIGDSKVLLAGFSWYPLPGYIQKKLNSNKVAKKVADSTGCAYRFWGAYCGFSDDDGKTWQSHHEYLLKNNVSNENTRTRKVAGATRGQAIQVKDELLLANYEGDGSCCLWSSSDFGFNWIKKSVIAKDSNNHVIFQEPSLYRCPSGKLVAFMRTSGASLRMASAQSFDNGNSWEYFQLHDIKGQPFHAIPINNDYMMLSYGFRESPFGVRCKLIDAECEFIDSTQELIIRDDSPCADCGYPWTVKLTEDRFLVTYYIPDKSGFRYIDGTVLALEK